MKTRLLLITVALAAAAPAFAQQEPDRGPYGIQQSAPGGVQQSAAFRDRSTEQSRLEQSVPADAPRFYRRHPGRLTKFGTSGISPEVQWEADRREAQQRARSGQ